MGTCPTLIPSRFLHKGTNVEKITFTLDADKQSRSCQLCKACWMLPSFPTVGLLKAWRNFMWQGDTTAFTVPAKTHRRNLRSYRNLRHWNRKIQDITFFYKMYIIYLWHWIFDLGDQVFWVSFVRWIFCIFPCRRLPFDCWKLCQTKNISAQKRKSWTHAIPIFELGAKNQR